MRAKESQGPLPGQFGLAKTAAVMGALNLYIDFTNRFPFLLRMGHRR